LATRTRQALGAGIFALFLAPLICVGLLVDVVVLRDYLRVASGIQTQATVVSSQMCSSSGSGDPNAPTSYHVTVRFTDQAGQQHVATDPQCLTDGQIGDQLTIYYQPHDPTTILSQEEVDHDTANLPWFGLLNVLVLGGLITLVVVILRQRHGARAKDG
jgi:hypothetical protein